MTELEDLIRFVALLKAHDYWYTMSDDYRVYKKGEAERQEIMELKEQIGETAADIYHWYVRSYGAER